MRYLDLNETTESPINAGDCFPTAGRSILNNVVDKKFPGLLLVHAMVRGQGRLKGKRFPHAWNEIGDVVIDYSNGNKIVMRKEQYYKLAGIDENEPGALVRYDHLTAIKKMARSKNFGPWDLDETLKEGIDLYSLHADPNKLQGADKAEKIPEIYWNRYQFDIPKLTELKHIWAKSSKYAYAYALKTNKRFKEGEQAISRNTYFATDYLARFFYQDFLKFYETLFKPDNDQGNYKLGQKKLRNACSNFLKEKSALSEALNLFKLHSDPDQLKDNDKAEQIPSVAWAKYKTHGPHELKKRKLLWAKDPHIALSYAQYMKQYAPSMLYNKDTGYRFIEGEPAILTDPTAAYGYCSLVLDRPFAPAESIIADDEFVALHYVKRFYKEQFKIFTDRLRYQRIESLMSPAQLFLKDRINRRLDEDWKSSAALGTALALAPGIIGDQPKPIQNKVVGTIKKPLSNQEQLKKLIIIKAKKAGLAGDELVHFISQTAHETLNFRRMEEVGTSAYFNKKYDIKYNPKKAKIIGNVNVGDGEKYKGRGFIQLTGRYNYKKAGQALGIPLETHPELAAIPHIAADVAIWYWQHRVQPNVSNFSASNIKNVTKKINPSMQGMKSRQTQYHAMADLK